MLKWSIFVNNGAFVLVKLLVVISVGGESLVGAGWVLDPEELITLLYLIRIMFCIRDGTLSIQWLYLLRIFSLRTWKQCCYNVSKRVAFLPKVVSGINEFRCPKDAQILCRLRLCKDLFVRYISSFTWPSYSKSLCLVKCFVWKKSTVLAWFYCPAPTLQCFKGNICLWLILKKNVYFQSFIWKMTKTKKQSKNNCKMTIPIILKNADTDKTFGVQISDSSICDILVTYTWHLAWLQDTYL